MSNANFHPDGFVPMNPPEQKWSDDVRALERGIAFFEELRSNGHTGVVTSGASVKPNSPLGGVQKPLTEEKVSYFTHQMILCCGQHPAAADINILGLIDIVRAIERAHGIGE